MLGVLFYAQAGVVLAACGMDRGELGQAMSAQPAAGHECCDEEESPPPANLCVAHCTADLQAFGWAALPLPAAAPSAPIFLQPSFAAAPPALRHPAPPPRVPPRIFLHSFLV